MRQRHGYHLGGDSVDGTVLTTGGGNGCGVANGTEATLTPDAHGIALAGKMGG